MKKSKPRIFINYMTGSLFTLERGPGMWYIMGSSVDTKMTIPLAYSRNKARLAKYAKKTLGLLEIV